MERLPNPTAEQLENEFDRSSQRLPKARCCYCSAELDGSFGVVCKACDRVARCQRCGTKIGGDFKEVCPPCAREMLKEAEEKKSGERQSRKKQVFQQPWHEAVAWENPHALGVVKRDMSAAFRRMLGYKTGESGAEQRLCDDDDPSDPRSGY